MTVPAEPHPAGGPAPQPADPSSPQPGRHRLDPMLLVLLGVAAGIAVAVLHHPRSGMFVVAAALGLGAALRLVLRPRRAGSLVVRNRRLDVLALAMLAAVVAVLAAVTPFPSGQG